MRLKHLVTQIGAVAFTVAAGSLTPMWGQAPTVNPRPAPQTEQIIAIRTGRLFDPKSGSHLRNQVVLITGDRITDVGSNVAIPPAATVIDLSKATVLPGMIDGHLHLSGGNARHHIPVSNDGRGDPVFGRADGVLMRQTEALKSLHAGFTTIVELGGSWDSTDLKNAINNGLIMGPRIMTAGTNFVVRAEGPVNSPDTAREAVREHAKRGADWIKLHTDAGACNGPRITLKPDGTMTTTRNPDYTLEIVKAVVDEAHKNGLKVADHLYGGEALDWAIEAGVDVLQHVVFATDEQLARAKAKGLGIGTTLFDMSKDHSADMKKFGNSCWNMVQKGFRKNYASGVKMSLASGSQQDGSGFPHGIQGQMLEWYVKLGLKPAEALRIATLSTAENIGWANRVGTIERGKYADIIAVLGDPLSDITEMQRVAFVMKGGDVVRSAGNRGWAPDLTPPRIDLPVVR